MCPVCIVVWWKLRYWCN